MKRNVVVTSICLLFLLAFSALHTVMTAAIASEIPATMDFRDMTFFDQMKTRNAEYATKSNWTLKVWPEDIVKLDSADENRVVVEVYVSDVEDTLQISKDVKTAKTAHVLQVYTAAERAVKQLAEIPNTHFYVSKYFPSISMTVKKQDLQQIANNPSVYCIRVIPPFKFLLSWAQVREQDDIEYTMANHDSTLDASTSMAVLDCGYDPNDSEYNEDGGWASDNIIPNSSWDFVDHDTDVTTGDNWHGSTVADTIVGGFGDWRTNDFSMYENRNFWVPLRISPPDGSTIDEHALEAIEWCIAHDIDIVNMSWGYDTTPIMGPNGCEGFWCNRFQVGTQQGMTWVAAAGNGYHTSGVCYPAESHFVVAVGGYDFNPAQRLSFSDYGYAYFAYNLWGGWITFCPTCASATWPYPMEFKPNAYECGDIGPVDGTSFAAPHACADIAIGIYSRNGGEYTEGYEYLLDVIALSNEYPVSPTASSLQGDVIDTHTLWHRSVISP